MCHPAGSRPPDVPVDLLPISGGASSEDVILTSEDAIETWMAAPAEEALRLQRPVPDDTLGIVARGERSDDSAA